MDVKTWIKEMVFLTKHDITYHDVAVLFCTLSDIGNFWKCLVLILFFLCFMLMVVVQ